MNRFFRTLVATSLLTPLNCVEFCSKVDAASPVALSSPSSPVLPSSSERKVSQDVNAFDFYVGANARWLVDRRRGVVSAWERERNVPLWSRDGVVFRLFERPDNLFADFQRVAESSPRPAPEIFGRVYFFLDVPPTSFNAAGSDATPRRDALLIALDPRAQGRLVWLRDAADFAPFFPPSKKGADAALRFVPEVVSAPQDALLLQVRSVDRFVDVALDAATGALRSVSPTAEPR